MSFKGCALSVRGASHEEAGEVCQDSARIHISDELAILAVSDGHGSEKHFRSASGSEMATRIAIRSISDFCEKNGGLDSLFSIDPENVARRIAANIIYSWNNEIAAHFKFAPLTDQERKISEKHGGLATEIMYGATLIAAAISDKGCFGLQIGDGSFVALKNEQTLSPVPVDSKLMGNLTTSLCDSDAIGSFRCFYSGEPFDAVMLSSDGLINSFRSEDDFMKFSRRVFSAVSEDASEGLPDHLKERSRCGSRDDISISAIVLV